jgi:hypothetical protein
MKSTSMMRVKVYIIGVKFIPLNYKTTKINHIAKMIRNNILESVKKHYSPLNKKK